MTKLNNILHNLSYLSIDLSLNLFAASNHRQESKIKYDPRYKNKLIYGNNAHYDSSYTDSSSEPELNQNCDSDRVTDITTQTTAIGYSNTRRLFTGRGNDTIIGLGNATVTENFQAIAFGESTSVDTFSTDRTARIAFTATVEATGISNTGRIATGRGNDTILGISDVQSTVSVLTESTAIDLSLATAKSESSILIDVLAIGVENGGKISLGQGKDFLLGIANTSTQSKAEATAIANAFGLDRSPEIFEELNNASAESNSMAEAVNLVSTIAIANRGNIFLNRGNDVIFGLANSQISSNTSSDSQAASSANQTALATANAGAFSIVESFTIGIINEGLIATGWGDDIFIGLAFNQSEANAEANAEAISETATTDSNTNTLAISDTLNVTAIGIDNSSGVIRMGSGKDLIIAFGNDIGIRGGNIQTGNDNDRIFAYGAFLLALKTRQFMRVEDTIISRLQSAA